MIEGLKQYPEYRESGVPWIGTIPSSWRVVRNGNLFRQRNQTDFGHLPILEVSLRTGVRVRDFSGSARKQVMSDVSKYKRAARGDLAYNMMRMWQGAVGIAPVDGLVSPAYVVATPYRETFAEFYSYLFRTQLYLGQVDSYSRGIVKDRNRLYWVDFKRMPSVFPPLAEQAAIVRFLGHAVQRIEAYIRAKGRLIALLSEQKQTVIQRAVTRGLDPDVVLKPSGIPWIGDIPEHWDVWRISRFARVGNGSTPSRSNPAYWHSGTYPWLNSSNVNRTTIDSADQFVTGEALRECHLPRVPTGSVLVAITGQGKTRGTAAVLGIEATINQHIAYITPKSELVHPQFLHLTFVAAYKTLRALSEDSGSTKGALTCEDLKRFKLAVPPQAEQKTLLVGIRSETSKLDLTIVRTEREIELLMEFRMRLISDVVTGQLDVRDAARDLPEEFDGPSDAFDIYDLAEDAELDSEQIGGEDDV